jgi:hypothetical protein
MVHAVTLGWPPMRLFHESRVKQSKGHNAKHRYKIAWSTYKTIFFLSRDKSRLKIAVPNKI